MKETRKRKEKKQNTKVAEPFCCKYLFKSPRQLRHMYVWNKGETGGELGMQFQDSVAGAEYFVLFIMECYKTDQCRLCCSSLSVGTTTVIHP